MIPPQLDERGQLASPIRWLVIALVFLAAVLNYVDKNTLALLAPTIQKDLHLSDQHYANIQNAFQVAYTVALLASGVIVDRVGAKLSMALFVGWWSVANCLTALCGSVRSFGLMRFALGLGEAGNWTGSPKAVADWFPPKERGLAIGIYTAGTPIGMTLAPVIIIAISQSFGWRFAFLLTGLLGLLWLIPWFFVYRLPKTGQELQIKDGTWALPALTTSPDESQKWTWRMALRSKAVWCLLLARMFCDPVWYFYQNWFPKYLVSDRGLTQADVKMTWVMFLAAGMGSLIGGWVAGRFIRNGANAAKARIMVMTACACVMPLSPLVAWAPSTNWALAVASLIVFAHLAWLTNISALVVDVVPAASLGMVFGIVAAGSSVGAILMNDAVAKLVMHSSYTQWFVIAAFLHILAIPLLFWGVWKNGCSA